MCSAGKTRLVESEANVSADSMLNITYITGCSISNMLRDGLPVERRVLWRCHLKADLLGAHQAAAEPLRSRCHSSTAARQQQVQQQQQLAGSAHTSALRGERGMRASDPKATICIIFSLPIFQTTSAMLHCRVLRIPELECDDFD